MSVNDRPVFLALGGLLTMAAANGIDRFVHTPILPAMMEQLGLSTAQAGLIASANFLGYLLGALFATRQELPGSRRGWLLGSLLLGGLCTGAMGMADSLPAFLILRGIGGFAGSVAVIVAIALVVERLAAGGKGHLASLHFSGVGIGIVLSAAIVSSLAAGGADWRGLWLAAAGASLAAAVAVAVLVGRQGITKRAALSAAREPVSRAFRLLIAANTLGAFGYVITATFIVALVRGSAELRPLEAWIWVVFGLATAPSVAVWSLLGRRVGAIPAFAAVCLVEAAGVAASVLWQDMAGTILAAILVGGSFMGLTALGMYGARQLTSGDMRRPVALMTTGFGVGQMIGPAFAGFVHDLTGSFLVPSLAAAAALAAAAVLARRSAALAAQPS